MSPTALADPQTAPASIDEEFTLNLRVVESTEPIAALRCNTNDGCGATCQTSACSSYTNNPF